MDTWNDVSRLAAVVTGIVGCMYLVIVGMRYVIERPHQKWMAQNDEEIRAFAELQELLVRCDDAKAELGDWRSDEQLVSEMRVLAERFRSLDRRSTTNSLWIFALTIESQLNPSEGDEDDDDNVSC